MNKSVEVTITGKDGEPKTVSIPLGKWWMSHVNRRSYERVIFAPGQIIPGNYNLWTGFGVEPKAGSCALYLNHILDNICRENKEYYTYVIGWMARAIQIPAEQGHVAIILQGTRGTGKGVFASGFGSLFGRHFMPVTHADHLVGKFNGHLRDCVALFGDEAFFAGARQHEGMLKVLISESFLTTEKKGIDPTIGRNYTHVILASNDEWVVPAGSDERRFLVLKVGEESKRNSSYFKAISDEMDSGGREALLHYLMHYDLSNFDVRDVPNTDALQAQKEFSFSPLEEWWYSVLQDGEIFEGEGWPYSIPRTNLRTSLSVYHKTYSTRLHANATKLGMFMRKVFPTTWDTGCGKLSGTHNVIDTSGDVKKIERPNGYLFPSIQVCRKRWEALFGGTFQWDTSGGTTSEQSISLQEEAF